jgi:hypothetical protein
MCSPLCCLYLLTKLRSVLDWVVFYLRIYKHSFHIYTLQAYTTNDEYDVNVSY